MLCIFQKMPEYEIIDFAKVQLTLPDKIDPADEMSWQHYLYSQLGSKKSVTITQTNEQQQKNLLEETVERIVAMSKVLYGLHMVCFYIYFISQTNNRKKFNFIRYFNLFIYSNTKNIDGKTFQFFFVNF